MTAQERDALLERLNADPAILGGVVCVRGTRIPVTLMRRHLPIVTLKRAA